MTAHLANLGVHEVEADDRVEHQHVGEGDDSFEVIYLPGRVTLYFDGRGHVSTFNLIGFLDQMHAIRAAVLEDNRQSILDSVPASVGWQNIK